MVNSLLSNKTAVVFGAGGSLGSTVAQSLADMGAEVYASNRSLEGMQALRGMKEVQQGDALDENWGDGMTEPQSGVTAVLHRSGLRTETANGLR